MTTSGFEGFEKRLELTFDTPDNTLGLRELSFDTIEHILDAVQCTVVSAISNAFFDAYVLSESSLFVYPHKIIIKTCGTTQLLRSIPILTRLTARMGCLLSRCRYSRGSFIFPNSQPYPHTSFQEEILFLEENLPKTLIHRKACILPSKTTHDWHVYSASVDPHVPKHVGYTLEVCMTQLNKDMARTFFQQKDSVNGGDVAGRMMTKASKIDSINPRAIVCDFGFDPCGYSMNGMDGELYSTIHVTPEEGFSYASFECNGYVEDGGVEVEEVLEKVVGVFRPRTVAVAVRVEAGNRVVCGGGLEGLGLWCCGEEVEEFGSGEKVVYRTFVVG